MTSAAMREDAAPVAMLSVNSLKCCWLAFLSASVLFLCSFTSKLNCTYQGTLQNMAFSPGEMHGCLLNVACTGSACELIPAAGLFEDLCIDPAL